MDKYRPQKFSTNRELTERWQKMALWVLLRVGLCVGQNPMCHLCVGIKIIFAGGLFLIFFLRGSRAVVGLHCQAAVKQSPQKLLSKTVRVK
ncbi:MAG: hypothetical protein KF856_19845 [Cyclobacteriaceae bacterium]|nr:hypothetical protein [Cyclobacteriaceae bacterium]UYN85534.1 MAG: hypothetical protein KIT51_11640 [Cyclobacteriaceae bacterium]